MSEHLADRQQEFVTRLGDLLREFTDVVGPFQEEEHDGKLYKAEDMAEMTPVRNAMLNEWMILSSWMNLDDGDMYTSAYCSPKMPTYHRLGMLYTWLEMFK